MSPSLGGIHNDSNCTVNTYQDQGIDPSDCAICSSCPATTPLGQRYYAHDCQPCSNFKYRTTDRPIHVRYQNSSTVSNKNYTRDCEQEWDSETCGWCFSCYKTDSGSDFGRCTSCGPTTRRKSSTNCRNYNYSKPTRYPWIAASAVCTVCTTKFNDSASSEVNVTCTPGYGYTFATYRTKVYNSTQQNSTAVDWTARIFETDCDM